MSVGNNNNAAFYNISNGKICRSLNTATGTSIERTNKNNRVVHEEFYDFIDGVITDIDTKDSEYGKSWIITLVDNGEKQVLQMPYSSGYSSAFLKTLPNVDLAQKVKFIPKLSIEGDKKKTTLFINQHGKALKHYYNKETPNGLPELVQKKVKGKTVWDDSDMMEFLENMVNTLIKPNLSKSGVPVDMEKEKEKMPF